MKPDDVFYCNLAILLHKSLREILEMDYNELKMWKKYNDDVCPIDYVINHYHVYKMIHSILISNGAKIDIKMIMPNYINEWMNPDKESENKKESKPLDIDNLKNTLSTIGKRINKQNKKFKGNK